MARKRRPYLPGAVFHLTTRTQGHEPWFTPDTRSRVVDYMTEVVASSDARLLAYAVMPNHLHLILRQGEWPLGRIMQPFLRRVALLVQRSHGLTGHVFERRFRSHLCLYAEYVRAAIVYVHLNPVRAGLVDDPRAYQWTSHPFYLPASTTPDRLKPALMVEDALGLFARAELDTRSELRRAYAACVSWRLECDRLRAGEAAGELTHPMPAPPAAHGGDLRWAKTFAPFLPLSGSDHLRARPWFAEGFGEHGPSRVPLEEVAEEVLRDRAPHIPLYLVRSAFKGREVVGVRRLMARRMRAAGHPGAAIADYLGVSAQCVSDAVCARNAPGGRAP